MLLPQLPQPNKKNATDHVGDLLRRAARQALAQEEAAPTDPLVAQLPGALQSQALPPLPQYGQPPVLQFPRSFEPDPRLSPLFGGPPDGVRPLELLHRAMQQRGQMPGSADFNLANVQGKTAGAEASLDAQFPNGFRNTSYQPLTLPGLAPREVPSFPNRPAPQSDAMGSLLGALVGFIDPVGAGHYNAEPLKAAADVANRQYADRLNQFEYAVQNAQNAYSDARNERSAQFEAAVQNQAQQNALRNFDQGRLENFAGLKGDVAGGAAYGKALEPLSIRGATATQGNALDSFVGEYLDRNQKEVALQNEAQSGNWRNAFELARNTFGDQMDLYNAGERSRNNTLDLLSALLRPQLDPLLSLRQGVMNSQIGVNKAREQSLLNPKGGAGGLTDYQTAALALRAIGMGIDPTNVPGAANIPGAAGVIQQNYQQKATALQMRDPRIRTAESDLRGRVIQRDALFRDYQTKLAQGLLDDATLRQPYIDSITRADREIQTATRARAKALEVLNTPPRTPGVSTGAPGKPKPTTPVAPVQRSAPPAKPKTAPKVTPTFEGANKPAAKQTQAAPGKKRWVFDPISNTFR